MKSSEKLGYKLLKTVYQILKFYIMDQPTNGVHKLLKYVADNSLNKIVN